MTARTHLTARSYKLHIDGRSFEVRPELAPALVRRIHSGEFDKTLEAWAASDLSMTLEAFKKGEK